MNYPLLGALRLEMRPISTYLLLLLLLCSPGLLLENIYNGVHTMTIKLGFKNKTWRFTTQNQNLVLIKNQLCMHAQRLYHTSEQVYTFYMA